jgi:hypothetical protein
LPLGPEYHSFSNDLVDDALTVEPTLLANSLVRLPGRNLDAIRRDGIAAAGSHTPAA